MCQLLSVLPGLQPGRGPSDGDPTTAVPGGRRPRSSEVVGLVVAEVLGGAVVLAAAGRGALRRLAARVAGRGVPWPAPAGVLVRQVVAVVLRALLVPLHVTDSLRSLTHPAPGDVPRAGGLQEAPRPGTGSGRTTRAESCRRAAGGPGAGR